VEGGLLLDVVVRKGPPILELLACKDEALLVRRDAFFILNLCLDIVYRVAGLDIQSDGLARQRLDEDLHASPQAEYQVEGGLLLDIIVRKGPPVLKLLACEDETLLVRRDTFFVLNLCLDIVYRVAGFDVQSDGLARQRLDEDLHAAPQA